MKRPDIIIPVTVNNSKVGLKVVRCKDEHWEYDNQGLNKIGKIIDPEGHGYEVLDTNKSVVIVNKQGNWVFVIWEGNSNSHAYPLDVNVKHPKAQLYLANPEEYILKPKQRQMIDTILEDIKNIK